MGFDPVSRRRRALVGHMIAPEIAPWVTGFIGLAFGLATVELALVLLRLGGRVAAGQEPQ